MKISMSGKGGSGKSTITTLTALQLRDLGYRPVVVDSDESNTVLFRMLGMPEQPQPLVALAGGRQMVRELMPPGYKPGEKAEGTHILTQARITMGELPRENVAEKDNIRLIVVGKILEPLEGCACPMGVLGREFLTKLQLQDDEIALVDMEAGLEHFGRGVESSLDAVLIVVEPSFESITLAERIRNMAVGMELGRTGAILNKANSRDLVVKITDELERRNVDVVSAVPYDEAIFSACLEGRPLTKERGSIEYALHKITDWIVG